MRSQRAAHFVTDLFVKELDDDVRRQLTQSLIFYSAELRGYLMAQEGAVVNYADVPQIFWSLFPRDGPWKRPSVLHDLALRAELVTLMGQPIHLIESLAHKLFREAMTTIPQIDEPTRELMYRVVRRFGPKVYGGLGAAA